ISPGSITGSPPPGQAGVNQGHGLSLTEPPGFPTWQQQGLGAAVTPQPTTSAVTLATASVECSTVALTGVAAGLDECSTLLIKLSMNDRAPITARTCVPADFRRTPLQGRPVRPVRQARGHLPTAVPRSPLGGGGVLGMPGTVGACGVLPSLSPD